MFIIIIKQLFRDGKTLLQAVNLRRIRCYLHLEAPFQGTLYIEGKKVKRIKIA